MPGVARTKVPGDTEKKSYQHRQERWVQKRKLRNETLSKLAEKQTNEKQTKETPEVKPKNQVTRNFSQANRESNSIKTTLVDLSQRVTALEAEIKLLKITHVEMPTRPPMFVMPTRPPKLESPLDMLIDSYGSSSSRGTDLSFGQTRRGSREIHDEKTDKLDETGSVDAELTESKEQCTPVDETPLNPNPDSDEEFVVAGTEIESRPKTKPPVKIV